MIDLYLVSVLLDAGAGTEWSYKSRENGRVYRRSEGIAVASLELFKQVRLIVWVVSCVLWQCRLTPTRDSSLVMPETSSRSTRKA